MSSNPSNGIHGHLSMKELPCFMRKKDEIILFPINQNTTGKLDSPVSSDIWKHSSLTFMMWRKHVSLCYCNGGELARGEKWHDCITKMGENRVQTVRAYIVFSVYDATFLQVWTYIKGLVGITEIVVKCYICFQMNHNYIMLWLYGLQYYYALDLASLHCTAQKWAPPTSPQSVFL